MVFFEVWDINITQDTVQNFKKIQSPLQRKKAFCIYGVSIRHDRHGKVSNLSKAVCRYKDAIRHRSQLMKDQPMSPQETVVYWTEYVIRHKGAKHLRSPTIDMTWWVWNKRLFPWLRSIYFSEIFPSKILASDTSFILPGWKCTTWMCGRWLWPLPLPRLVWWCFLCDVFWSSLPENALEKNTKSKRKGRKNLINWLYIRCFSGNKCKTYCRET